MHADFEDSAVEAGGERHKRDAPGVSAPPKNSSITQNTTKGGISSPSALAPPSLFKPRPLFIHMDFMSDKGFQTDVDYFQNSVRWRLEGDPKEIRYWSGKVSPADFESAAYAEVGGFPGYKKCFSLKKVKGVEVILDGKPLLSFFKGEYRFGSLTQSFAEYRVGSERRKRFRKVLARL
ncbi:hypothetical protein DFJ73DRAFT_392993 [Zopfochytrium polystomum]|nr:hypothetical protein DFJ73DRAFT_392993 [Zopfochytrium polystomum]